MRRVGGESGHALVGGRLAVVLGPWRGRYQGGEWCITARALSVNRFLLAQSGGYVDLRLQYGAETWRFRAALGVSEAGEVEAWATGNPEVRSGKVPIREAGGRASRPRR